MTQGRINQVKSWIEDYVHSLGGNDSSQRKAFSIKLGHTTRVHENVVELSLRTQMYPEVCYLAEITALLHDIGRFDQFKRYKTFDDSKSVNHAKLGVEVVDSEKILSFLTNDQQKKVRYGIANHNKPSLVDGRCGDLRCDLIAKLVRDGDKLDIWSVVVNNYEQPSDEHAILSLGFPNTEGITAKVVEGLVAHKPILYRELQNLNDLKVFQLSWVFDLNFPSSVQLCHERGLVRRLLATLPELKETTIIRETVEMYVQNRLKT